MIELLSKEELDAFASVVAFSKDKPFCWSLMPAMLERIGKFAERYCPDTMPPLLLSHVMKDFTAVQQGFFILGAVQDEELVGHLLTVISVPPWSNNRRALVLQYEIDDEARAPLGLLRAGLDLVVDWAKTQYCSKIIAETKTEKMKRLFTMCYGFKLDMIQVEREF